MEDLSVTNVDADIRVQLDGEALGDVAASQDAADRAEAAADRAEAVLPYILNKEWFVNLGAPPWTNNSDTENVNIGIKAAFAEYGPATYRFTKPFGQAERRYWLGDTRPGSTIWSLPKNGTLIFDDGAYVDAQDWETDTLSPSGRHIFNATGTIGDPYPLTLDGLKDQPFVRSPALAAELNSRLNQGKSTWIIIGSDEPFTREDTLANKAENHIVSRLNGDDVYFDGALVDNYYLEYNPAVYIVDPVSWTMRNPQIKGPGRFVTNVGGDRGIVFNYGRGCDIDGGLIERVDFACVAWSTVIDSLISNLTCRQDNPEFTASNFNVCFAVSLADGCQGVTVRDTTAYGGSQQFVLTGGGPLGVTRAIIFQVCIGSGAFGGTFTQHSCHEDITYSLCESLNADTAFDIRVRNTRILDAKVKNLPPNPLQTSRTAFTIRGRGWQHLQIDRCQINDAFRGTRLFAVGGLEGRPYLVQITRNEFLNMVNNGIHIDWPYDSMPMFGLIVDENVTKNFGAVRPIEVNGTFENPKVRRNEARGGSGLTPSRPVLLGSSHTCFGHAPWNSEVSGTRWERFLAPLVVSRFLNTTANVCFPQSRLSAGDLVINGATARGAANVPGVAVQIKADAGDHSGVSYTIGGINHDEGRYFGSTMAVGPTAGQTKVFMAEDGVTPVLWDKIFFVSRSTSMPGAARVGTAADDDLICLSQSGTSPVELIINGAGAYVQAIFGGPQILYLTCAGDQTGRYFWIYGTGEGGDWQSEKIWGANNGVVKSINRWRSVYAMTANVTHGNTVKLGIESKDDCVCLSQLVDDAHALTATLNGDLSVITTAMMDRSRLQSLTADTADEHLINYTWIGTNDAGEYVTDTRPGPNAAGKTIYTLFDYKTVAHVKTSGPTAGTVRAGTNLVMGETWTDNRKSGSSGSRTITASDSPFTPDMGVTFIFCDTNSGPITIQYPPISFAPHHLFEIKNVGTSGNNVTILPDGTDTVSDPTLLDGEVTRQKNDGATRWEEFS